MFGEGKLLIYGTLIYVIYITPHHQENAEILCVFIYIMYAIIPRGLHNLWTTKHQLYGNIQQCMCLQPGKTESGIMTISVIL